jgi:AraC-like DNA-binding protein
VRDQVFSPSRALKPFVQYYWTCRHPDDVLEVMYPSGSIELCIDIAGGDTVRHRGDRSMQVPRLELLGHWTMPTSAAIKKGNTCLITRFYPYAGALFFPNRASEFTNESVDFYDIFGKGSADLYDLLMEQPSLQQKIKVLEEFLLQRLMVNRKSDHHLHLVESLCNDIAGGDTLFNIQSLSAHYGFSERYIQKIFSSWVGLTPQKFFAVRRFNKSLELLRSSEEPMTSIAFACGYYDQAHFIKEFRSYTGLTPTQLVAHRK